MSNRSVSYFEKMKETKEVKIESNRVVESTLGNSLKCVKKVGHFKIYVDFFMSVKKYYVLNTETNEIRFGGVWNLSNIIEMLQEEIANSES